jgi:hypothetical protein
MSDEGLSSISEHEPVGALGRHEGFADKPLPAPAYPASEQDYYEAASNERLSTIEGSPASVEPRKCCNGTLYGVQMFDRMVVRRNRMSYYICVGPSYFT